LLDADGDDMVVQVSSRHFKVAADKATEDDIDLFLSGKTSMAMLTLGGGVRMYFQPFN
jgi:hypothetical protein